jgi:hypothetical protein
MNTAKAQPLALLVAAAALTACAGCSNALPTSAKSTAPAASATVAFAASESDLAPACATEGMPRVVATHVAPMAGVTAESDGARIWLHFATRNDPRAALAIDPSTLNADDEDGAAPREAAGDAPAPAPNRIASGPVAVGIEGGRQLLAWTDGSTYMGLRVLAVTLGENGAQVGAPIDLGYEGSAIGRPAVAVASSGRGVLAFEESNGAGFHLVAVRIVCGATRH